MRSWIFLPLVLTLPVFVVTCSSSSSTNSTDVTSSASTTGGEIVILDGGGGVPSPPDGKSKCPMGACNYQTNDGCGGGDTCFPSAADAGIAPSCLPAGSKMDGAACSPMNDTDCAPGYVCAGGACHKLCCGGDWSACPNANEHCIVELLLGSAMTDTGAMLCFPVNNCDPLNPSMCPNMGETCKIVDPSGAVACGAEGTVDVGAACSPSAQCKGGAVCVSKTCRRLCKAVEGGGDPSCQSGEGNCVHFDRDPDGVGECTP